MIYVYPKFSEHEIPGLRFGGPGLGNLLFIYSRALIYAKKYDYELIWPTWPSLKVGPWIRREKDKRFYGDLFRNNGSMIGGLKKEYILLHSKSISVSKWKPERKYKSDIVINYDYFSMNFGELLNYHDLIYNNLKSILNNKSKAYKRENFNQTINVHVRLGDFSSNNDQKLRNGSNNTRIGISWYASVISKLQKIVGNNIRLYIFSDGSDEELKEIFAIPNVERKFFGNSIADIFALSRSRLMIASGSSFSLWARFLGQQSSISFPGQIKEKVLAENTEGFEIELEEGADISNEIATKIKAMYR